jgi:iron complex transport system permease protein
VTSRSQYGEEPKLRSRQGHHQYIRHQRARYQRTVTRRLLILAASLVLLLLAFVIDVMSGPSGLAVQRVVRTILTPASVGAPTWAIVWLVRLPSALMALAVGAGLGVAGVEMQTILGNSLASPFTLGIAAAAGFGAALALVLKVGVIPVAGQVLVPINAFAGTLLTSLSVFAVARSQGTGRETIVLVGIALHSLFNAMLALLEFLATDEQLRAVVFWLFGSLEKATWTNVGIVWAVLLVVLPFFAIDAWKLTALRTGEAKAESLGVDVARLRWRVLFLTSLLTATGISFVGTIGFVGLVAPHIARMLVGEDQRFLMPLSALTGALLLSVAAIVSKSMVRGAVLPVGVVTAFVGVPFFLSLILVRRHVPWSR